MAKRPTLISEKDWERMKTASNRILRPTAKEELSGLPRDLIKAINDLAGIARGFRIENRNPGEDRPDGFK